MDLEVVLDIDEPAASEGAVSIRFGGEVEALAEVRQAFVGQVGYANGELRSERRGVAANQVEVVVVINGIDPDKA